MSKWFPRMISDNSNYQSNREILYLEIPKPRKFRSGGRSIVSDGLGILFALPGKYQIDSKIKYLKFFTRLAYIAVSLFLVVGSAQPSYAQVPFTVCNYSSGTTDVAVGYVSLSHPFDSFSQGWTSIQSGECKIIHTNQVVYFDKLYAYAIDIDNGSEFKGKETFCIDNKDFYVRGAVNCEKIEFITAGFFKVGNPLTYDDGTIIEGNAWKEGHGGHRILNLGGPDPRDPGITHIKPSQGERKLILD